MFFKVITTIAVAVAIFVLAVQTPVPHGEGDGIAIPLTKRSDTDVRELFVTSHSNANISRGPCGMDASGSERTTETHPSAVQRDGFGASLSLANAGKGIWFGTIFIGTPPKPFEVQLNTGFSDLLVPSLTGDRNCRSHQNLWDPASYQTTDTDFDLDFTIILADGRTASGKQYMEPVTIAGVTADSQTIGVATGYSSSLGITAFAPDGILGLGFPSLAQLHYESPLLHTLFNEGKLPQPVFSLMLTSGGELYLGGMNTARYIQSTLLFTPVTSPVFWQLKIDDIRVNEKIVLRDVLANIDTGGNSICGDTYGVTILHAAAGGGKYKDPVGYYTFPCKSFPSSVTFTIGGKPIVMLDKVLNRGQVMFHSKNCFSGIVATHTEHDPLPWSLGTIFLEQVYTVFDFNPQSPRVGFAQLASAR